MFNQKPKSFSVTPTIYELFSSCKNIVDFPRRQNLMWHFMIKTADGHLENGQDTKLTQKCPKFIILGAKSFPILGYSLLQIHCQK